MSGGAAAAPHAVVHGRHRRKRVVERRARAVVHWRARTIEQRRTAARAVPVVGPVHRRAEPIVSERRAQANRLVERRLAAIIPSTSRLTDVSASTTKGRRRRLAARGVEVHLEQGVTSDADHLLLAMQLDASGGFVCRLDSAMVTLPRAFGHTHRLPDQLISLPLTTLAFAATLRSLAATLAAANHRAAHWRAHPHPRHELRRRLRDERCSRELGSRGAHGLKTLHGGLRRLVAQTALPSTHAHNAGVLLDVHRVDEDVRLEDVLHHADALHVLPFDDHERCAHLDLLVNLVESYHALGELLAAHALQLNRLDCI
mmetsp:Transcript_30467/g.74120  ORF Transcript_30467/g.74120 Transcript_30467/m.74120 type:complete len:315 (+) Transcript_30467:253-1197(+)